MECTSEEWNNCRVEKMGCEGCYYNDNEMKLEEAIEKLNKLKEKANIEDMDMNDCFNGEHIEAIETVLKHLEEQDKEIVKYQLYLTEDVIPKKKIEDKINKLDLEIDEEYERSMAYHQLIYARCKLKELLEEKDNARKV